MAQTLLKMVQQATAEIGIPQPSLLFGSTDDQIIQILSLAQREGSEFSSLANRAGGWTALHEEYNFATVASAQSYDMPADFEYFIQRTFWDGAYRWSLLDPITAQEKQLLKYGLVGTNPYRKFYIRKGRIYLEPTPTVSGDNIAFDYYSNYWCKSPTGDGQPFWVTDNDTYKLDEQCFIQGIKWRYLRAKGLDYSQEKLDYEDSVKKVLGRDGGTRELDLTGGANFYHMISAENSPVTGYGV